MSPTPFVVSGPTPTCVVQSGHPVFSTVYNPSTTATLYLEDTPAGQGFPLGPGSTITWDANKPLYLHTDAGQTISAVVVDNGGTLTDAGAIAGQIIAQGLGADIASHIAVSGAPPVDAMAIILNNTYTENGGGYIVGLDASKYQSITVQIREHGLTSYTVPVVRTVELIWGPTDGIATDAEQFGFWDDKGNNNALLNYATYTTSVKDVWLNLSVDSNTQTGNSITITVTGSYKTCTQPRYVNRSAYFGAMASNTTIAGIATDGLSHVMAQKVANVGYAEYPPTKNGPVTVSITADSCTVAGAVNLIDGITNTLYACVNFPVLATFQSVVQNVYLPARPIRMSMGGSLAATNVRVSIIFPY